MDPVNKWLTTIIMFMTAFLIVVSWKAGSGRYELAVEKSTLLSNYAVVYVLDTKNGKVHAKLVKEGDLQNKYAPLRKALKVFELPSPSYRADRGY